MKIKAVRNLKDFVVNGIQSQEQTLKCSTCDFIGQMELNRLFVSLQVWMSAVGDKIVVNGEKHKSNDLFFHVYDASTDPKAHKVLIRFFKGKTEKVPNLNEKSENDLFQVSVNMEESEGIGLMANGEDLFSGGSSEDLLCALSGQDDLLKVKTGDDGHVKMPISKLMAVEPTADVVLKLWHKLPGNEQFAVERGRRFFKLVKSIYERMKITGADTTFDPDKCYTVFVESSFHGVTYQKIGIVKIEDNKPQFVIIPEQLYDGNQAKAAVSSHTNNFKSEVVKGTLADVLAFFGRTADSAA